jgi:hypothetical protein
MDSNTGGHSLVASLIPVAEQSVKDSLLDVCSDLSNCKSQLGREGLTLRVCLHTTSTWVVQLQHYLHLVK